MIGAGAAGLSAAAELSRRGWSIALLEARSRVGGRIHTLRDPLLPVPLELGAEFIHGEAEDTLALVQAAMLQVHELPDDHYISRDGRFSAIGDFWAVTEQVGRDIARRLGRRAGKDFTLADYLRTAKLPAERAQLIQDFVEGYHAAHLDLVSARVMASAAGDDDNADAQFRLAEGYGALVEALCGSLPADATLYTGTIATELRWKRGDVHVEATNALGEPIEGFHARRAIVAIPHALLRAGTLRFTPELPAVRNALQRLEAGQVFKIMLRFREAFWGDMEFVKKRLTSKRSEPAELNFVHAHGTEVPTWWTQLPARAPLLTGWSGGPKAEAMLARPEQTRVELALEALSSAFGVPRKLLDDQLQSWTTHDWQADPWSRGAYTYPGIEATAAQKTLSRAVQGTLAFAGEYTDAEQIGTVAAAIASGRRAAGQL